MGDFSEGRFDPTLPWKPIVVSASHLVNNSHLYTPIGGPQPAGQCQICKDGCINSQHDVYARLDREFRFRTRSGVGLSEHLRDSRRIAIQAERDTRNFLDPADLWPEFLEDLR